MAERLFAIPDIHGRADLLEVIINRLTREAGMDLEKDKLVFLGDMIDRGWNSKQVIDAIRQFKDMAPENVIVLAGNHEWLCVDAYRSDQPHAMDLWHMNGGRSTEASFGGTVPDDYLDWMSALPLQFQEDGFFFSHAPVPVEEVRGIHKGKPYKKHELIWTYHEPEDQYARKHDDLIGVCGHIHALRRGVMEPRLYPHYIFADAGAGCHPNAPLVAIEVKSREMMFARPGDQKK